MEFLENTLKIEDTKSIQIEKAYILGKRKNGPTKPRPLFAKFTNFKDRAAVKNSSKRLKNTKYGISPHYPREMVERRKKLVPIMLNEQKNGKTAYIVGDKLFINGSLWKGQEAAECDENSTENESSGKSVINICTWNISKGLVRKLSDSGFLNISERI